MNTPLNNGTIVGTRYQIGRPRDQQTDGTITYLCSEKNTRKTFIVEEFYPSYAIRQEGNRVDYTMLPDDDQTAFREHFFRMQRFGALPTIPKAYELFAENNTIYAVYEMLTDDPVSKLKESHHSFTYDSVRRMLLALLQTNCEMMRFGFCQPEFHPENVLVSKDGNVKLQYLHPVKDADAQYRAVKSIAALGFFMIMGKSPDAVSKVTGLSSGSNLSRLAKYLKWVYQLPEGAITIEQMIYHAQINFDVNISEQVTADPAMRPENSQNTASSKKMPLWAILTVVGILLILIVGMFSVAIGSANKAMEASSTDLVITYSTTTNEETSYQELKFNKSGGVIPFHKAYHNAQPLEGVKELYLKVEGGNETGFNTTVTTKINADNGNTDGNDKVIQLVDDYYYHITVDASTTITVRNEYFQENILTKLLAKVPALEDSMKKSSTYTIECSPRLYAKLATVTYTVDDGDPVVADVGKQTGGEITIDEKISCDAKTITVTAAEGPQGSSYACVFDEKPITVEAKLGEETYPSVQVTVNDPKNEADPYTYTVKFILEAKPVATVPELNKDPEKMKKSLEDAGFTVDMADKPTANKGENEIVLSMDPEAGKEVEQGSKVTVYVGKYDPNLKKITIPDVVGFSESAARQKIMNAGAKVTTKEVYDDATAGKVIEQNPKANSQQKPNTTVTLTVSKGPKPTHTPTHTPTPTATPGQMTPSPTPVVTPVVTGTLIPEATPEPKPKKVKVPDVKDQTFAQAQQTLGNFKLEAIESEEPITTKDQNGKVIRTEPVAGQPVVEGTQVTVVIGKYEPPVKTAPPAPVKTAPPAPVKTETPAPVKTAPPAPVKTETPAPQKVEVPNVAGSSYNYAKAQLNGKGLTVEKTTETVNKPEGKDKVIRTEPSSGALVNSGTTVTVVVGRYVAPSPTPSPTPEAKNIVVPNMNGM